MKKLILMLILLLCVVIYTLKSQPQVTTTMIQPSCPGDSNGLVMAVVDSGTAPFSFLWNTGDTLQTVKNMKAGTYSVIVTDATNAKGYDTIVVIDPVPLSVSFVVTNNSSWPLSNGSAIATLDGGSGKYFVLYQDSASTQEKKSPNLTGVPGGTYYVYIEDEQKCVLLDTIKIGEANAPLQVLMDLDSTACYRSTATQVFQPVGGNALCPLVVVSLDDTVTIKEILPAPIGSPRYINLVDDTLTSIDLEYRPGAQWVTVYSVPQQRGFRHYWPIDSATEPLTIEIASINQISCFGADNGSLDFTAQGEYGDYLYDIWGPSGFHSINNYANTLAPGNYRFRVTDSTGCYKEITTTILEPQPLKNNFNVIKKVLCHDDSTAIVEAVINGGTGNYTYLWENGSSTSVCDSLFAGTHTVRVRDERNCLLIDSVTLNNPPAITSMAWSAVMETCYGQANGMINANIAGGTPPLQYVWLKNGNEMGIITYTSTLSNLRAGVYDIVVKDANMCLDTFTYTITSPTEIVVTETVVNNTCYPDSVGSITLVVNNGNPATTYTYAWSDGATVANRTALGNGKYAYTITNTGNACKVYGEKEIISYFNAPIDINAEVTPSSCVRNVYDGKFVIHDVDNILKPEMTLTYLQTGEVIPISVYQTINKLDTGIYVLHIQNSSVVGCEFRDTIHIGFLNEPCQTSLYEGFSPDGDGINDVYVIEDEFLQNNPTVTISVGNHVVFNSKGYDSPWDGIYGGKPVPEGKYVIVITYEGSTHPLVGEIIVKRK